MTFGTVSVDKSSLPQSPQQPQSQPQPSVPYSQQRRDSTHSNHSVGEHSPAQSPHYQNNNNNNTNRHYGSPRHYNQGKHMNASYSPNMTNAQPGYMPHHAKKPMSPHMASTSPSAQNIPVAQNSWTNSIPGQYYVAPNYDQRPPPQGYDAGPPQYYTYNQIPVPTYTQPGSRQNGGQQNFVPQAARTSKAIPIINPATMAPVKADPLAPASTSPSISKTKSPVSSDKKEKDFKIQASPSPKRGITIVDPAVKELEEREKREKEEAERKAKEDEERRIKEEEERKIKEEEERKAKEEAERKAKEEAERLAKEEAERKAKEEQERKAKEEADRLAKEEADRKAKEEQERLAKEEADRKAKEEEIARKERAAAAAAAVAEAERKVREDRERIKAAERKLVEEEIQ
ncbi:uncharacterized protein BX664DRAFT_275251, partial [Halteromyces radiatus]|uniref:uncharacterized protein n=1 Tax=Halteromyces radiatus TaxID=101107 RepID=UPI0022212140